MNLKTQMKPVGAGPARDQRVRGQGPPLQMYYLGGNYL
jgi:hypothetical protein